MGLALDHLPEAAAVGAGSGLTAPPPAQLRRAIKLPHATALVVGIIIGASIFVQPSEVTTRVPSIAGVLIVWLAAGALTFAGARVCADLAAMLPRSGGVYVFSHRSVRSRTRLSLGLGDVLDDAHRHHRRHRRVIFARYAGSVVAMDDTATRCVAIGVVWLLSIINYFGVKEGSRVQAAFTAAKLLAIAAIVAAGFAFGGRVPEHFVGTASAHAISVADFFAALAAGLFAFGGWHMVSYSAGETVDPERTIPRALFLGTLIVTAAYVALNAVYLYVLPLDRVAASTHVAADLATTLFGPTAGRGIALVVMFSSFGALGGVILTGPRVYLAMAEDGLLVRWIGGVHPTFRTPHRAILLQAAWASVLVATGSFRALFTRVVYTEWIFFGLLAIGLMLLRRRFALLPAVFAIAAFAVAANSIVANPKDAVLGLGFVLTGGRSTI